MNREAWMGKACATCRVWLLFGLGDEVMVMPAQETGFWALHRFHGDIVVEQAHTRSLDF